MVSLHTIVGCGKWDGHIPLSNYLTLRGDLKAYYIPGPDPEVSWVCALQEDPLFSVQWRITVHGQYWPEFLSLVLKYEAQTSQITTVAYLNDDYRQRLWQTSDYIFLWIKISCCGTQLHHVTRVFSYFPVLSDIYIIWSPAGQQSFTQLWCGVRYHDWRSASGLSHDQFENDCKYILILPLFAFNMLEYQQ